jgi:hypothetical protein
MKYKIIFFLFLVILSSCSNDDKNNSSNVDKKTTDYNDSIKKIEELNIKNQLLREELEKTDDLEVDYFYTLNNGLPIPIPKELKWKSKIDTIVYTIIPKRGSFETDLIKLSIYQLNKLIQTINYNDDCYFLELIDWNFDGYKDISILYDAGATGNTTYRVWLYNPKKKTFILDSNFLTGNCFIDTNKGFIIKHYREGSQFEIWEYYKCKNNKLIFNHSKEVQFLNYGKKGTWDKITRKSIRENKEIITADSVEI